MVISKVQMGTGSVVFLSKDSGNEVDSGEKRRKFEGMTGRACYMWGNSKGSSSGEKQ